MSRRIPEVWSTLIASGKIICGRIIRVGHLVLYIYFEMCASALHPHILNFSYTHFESRQTQSCPTYLAWSCKHCPSCVFYQLTVLSCHCLLSFCCVKGKLFILAFHSILQPVYLSWLWHLPCQKHQDISGHSLIFFKQVHYCFLPRNSSCLWTFHFFLFLIYLITFCLQGCIIIIVYLVD